MPTRTTHRNVVIGVTILAVLALFNVWFWTGIGVVNVINPPEPDIVFGSTSEGIITLDDYLSGGRIFIGLVVGVIGSAVSWAITDSIVSD